MPAKVSIRLLAGSSSFSVLLPELVWQQMRNLGIDVSAFEGRANSLHLPVGGLTGRGYILVDSLAASSLDPSQPVSLEFAVSEYGDVLYNNTVRIDKLYVVAVKSVTSSVTRTAKDVFEVELADVRYVLRQTAVLASYNVRTPSSEPSYRPYEHGSTDPYYRANNWTWQAMLEDIWSRGPGITSLDLSLASFPSIPPENYEFWGVSVLDAVLKVAEDTGNVFLVRRDGTCFLQAQASSINDAVFTNAANYVQLNSHEERALRNIGPEKLVVVFPARKMSFQSGPANEVTPDDYHRMEPVHVIELSTGSVGAIAGTKHVVHSALLARYDSAGNLLNGSELEAYAEQVKNSWALRFSNPKDRYVTYSGAWPFDSDFALDVVSWYDTGDGLFTRIRYRDQFVSAEDFGLPWSKLLSGAIAADALRPSVPNLYEEVEHTVRWGIATLLGDLEKGGSQLAIVQYASGEAGDSLTWSNSSHQIRVFEPLGRKYRQQQRIYVVFHRQAERWLALSSADNRLIRFKMKSKLPLGGRGVAIEVLSGPAFTEVGAPFPIKDPWTDPGMWREDVRDELRPGKGYKGWCILPEDAEILQVSGQDPLAPYDGQPVREIIWMEQIARSITFTSTEPMDRSVAPWRLRSHVDNYYLQGKDPADTDLVISQGTGDIYVYDPQEQFPRALSQARGKARYNDRDHRYEIVVCNQLAILLKGYLKNKLCGESQAVVTGLAALTFPPYGQKPDQIELTVQNPLGLAGNAQDPVIVVWDESTESWVLLQVRHKVLRILRDLRLRDEEEIYQSGSGPPPPGAGTACNPFYERICRLEGLYANVYLMYCQLEDEWQPIVTFQGQEVLTDWWVEGLFVKGMAATVYVPCKTPEYECDLEEAVECPTYGSGQ